MDRRRQSGQGLGTQEKGWWCVLWIFFSASCIPDLVLVKPATQICQWAQTNKASSPSLGRTEAAQQTENFQPLTTLLQPNTTEKAIAPSPPAMAEWGIQTSTLMSLTTTPSPCWVASAKGMLSLLSGNEILPHGISGDHVGSLVFQIYLVVGNKVALPSDLTIGVASEESQGRSVLLPSPSGNETTSTTPTLVVLVRSCGKQ